MRKYCFCSWSGGKDSCLAFYKAREQGYDLKRLLTMFSMESGISSIHRLKEEIIRAQANAIGIECSTGWAMSDEYEEMFVSNIKLFKEQGIDYGVFGDIDLAEHREWEERVCNRASVTAVLPLWQMERKELVKESIDLGFKAKIVVVDLTMMDPRFLGRDLSYSLIDEIEEYGADVCGENGEYHTVVYDGPVFRNPVNLKFGAEIIPVREKWAQIDVSVV